MKSKNKRYVLGLVMFVAFVIVYAFAAAMVTGFGWGLTQLNAAAALSWVGATVILAPVVYISLTELIQWMRNYEESDAGTPHEQSERASQPSDGSESANYETNY